MKVRLAKAEVLIGALVGVHRFTDCLLAGRTEVVPGIGEGAIGWGRDIEGALAEVAFAKVSDRFWDASQWRFRGSPLGDVGPFQVRHTEHGDGHLIVRPHDSDAACYVLVTGCAPSYEVVGTIEGDAAKADAYRRDPGGRNRPCYWVPQSALCPIGGPF